MSEEQAALTAELRKELQEWREQVGAQMMSKRKQP